MTSDRPPQAQIEFPRGFSERVARFAFVQAAQRRTPREELAGSLARSGYASGEFAGRRRYSPGDDLRAFDWEALARGAGRLVRLRSRDGGERWNVLLDTSLSMAVGEPAKLQLAAQLALALCAVGLAWGSEVRLATVRGVCVLRSKRDLARAFAELAGLACSDAGGLAALFSHAALARSRRWIAVGDLFDIEPAIARRFSTGRQRLDAFAVLAHAELAPLSASAQDSSVEWRDPETRAKLVARLGTGELSRYASLLSQHLAHWRTSLARAQGELVIARAGDPFEPHARHWIANLAP